MEFLEFPTEIVEIIINHIDEPSDLLSLALATMFLSNIIVPDHIQLRWLCAYLGRTKVWHNMINKPYISTRVRKLRLEHLGTVIQYMTPPQFTRNMREELNSTSTTLCFGLFLEALRCMDLSSIYFEFDKEEQDWYTFPVLKTLSQTNGALEELDFTWPISPGLQHDFTQILVSPGWKLSTLYLVSICHQPLRQLCRLAVTIESPVRDIPEDALKNFCYFMKLHCQLIVGLRIVFRLSVDAVRLIWNSLRQTDWPNLQFITIQQIVPIHRLYPQGFTDFLDWNPRFTNIFTQGVEFPPSSHYHPKWLGEIQSLTLEPRRSGRIPTHPYLSSILHPQTLSLVHHFNTNVSRECLPAIRQMSALRSCVGHLQLPLLLEELLGALPLCIEYIHVYPSQAEQFHFLLCPANHLLFRVCVHSFGSWTMWHRLLIDWGQRFAITWRDI